MSFRLVPKLVTLNDLERRNSQPPRNFTEFSSFRDGHDMEVFMYVLRSGQCRLCVCGRGPVTPCCQVYLRCFGQRRPPFPSWQRAHTMFSFLTAAIISQLNGLGPSFLLLLYSAAENYVCGPPRGVPQIRSAAVDFQAIQLHSFCANRTLIGCSSTRLILHINYRVARNKWTPACKLVVQQRFKVA